LDQGHYDDELVHVGDQDVLAAPGSTGEHAMPRLDPLDHTFVISRVAEPDAVAGGDNTPFVRRQALEQPADGAPVKSAVFSLDDALKAVDTDHPPRSAFRLARSGHPLGRL